MHVLIRRSRRTLAGFVLVAALCAAPVANGASAVSLAQTFNSTETLVSGELVSAAENDTRSVVAAQPDNKSRLVGVVVAAKEATAVLSGEATAVAVSQNGTTEVWATDLNGELKAGDKLAVSPIIGVGMKAVVPEPIVGTVKGGFVKDTTRREKITDLQGKVSTVTVGKVPVLLGLATYVPPGSVANSFIPVPVQRIVYGITGHSVSPTRIALGVGLLALGVIFLAVLIYTSVRHSLIAIGRNPLASNRVLGGLTRIAIATIVIMVALLGAVYAILAL